MDGISYQGVGISRAAGDARYVPRFVGATLAGDTYNQVVSSGATEVVLGNPSGAVHGGIPKDASPSLLDAGDGARIGTRVRMVRIGNAAVLVAARANGSFQAPTAVLINQSIGGLAANAYHGTGYVFTGQLVFVSREVPTPTAGGSLMQVQVNDVGGTSAKSVAVFRGGGANVSEWLPSEPTGRIIGGSTSSALRNPANTVDLVSWNATGVGFQGSAPIAKPAVTGSRVANPALASLLTQLAAYGLITDSTIV